MKKLRYQSLDSVTISGLKLLSKSSHKKKLAVVVASIHNLKHKNKVGAIPHIGSIPQTHVLIEIYV